jgi:hypothetical protein
VLAARRLATESGRRAGNPWPGAFPGEFPARLACPPAAPCRDPRNEFTHAVPTAAEAAAEAAVHRAPAAGGAARSRRNRWWAAWGDRWHARRRQLTDGTSSRVANRFPPRSNRPSRTPAVGGRIAEDFGRNHGKGPAGDASGSPPRSHPGNAPPATGLRLYAEFGARVTVFGRSAIFRKSAAGPAGRRRRNSAARGYPNAPEIRSSWPPRIGNAFRGTGPPSSSRTAAGEGITPGAAGTFRGVKSGWARSLSVRWASMSGAKPAPRGAPGDGRPC